MKKDTRESILEAVKNSVSHLIYSNEIKKAIESHDITYEEIVEVFSNELGERLRLFLVDEKGMKWYIEYI